MNLSFLFIVNQNRYFNLIFGAVFLAFFAIGFKAIDPMFYLDRDDGIISFSHIINLEKYGFLGVSPSGERVESFSTPIHILIFLIFRILFGVDYHAHGILQSLGSAFFIGYIIILFFKEKDNISKFFIAALAGSLLVLSIRFFQWHSSGLENPLTSVFFLFFAYKLIQSGKGEISFWSGISFGLASITRIESVFFTFPLIGLFWLISGFSTRYLIRFILPGILFLAVIHLSRYAYFGDFFPNTAKGQNISLSQNILDTFLFKKEYWDANLKVFNLNFRYNHGYLYLSGLLILVFIRWKKHKNLAILLGSFLILSFFHLFIFNATRLDSIRYASYLAPLGVLVAMLVFIEAKERLLSPVFYAAFLPAFFGISFLAHKPIFQICCEDKIFLRWNEEMTKTRSDQAWHRPLVSNPDLGIVSYRKEYNILDLGLIGSKLTANLQPCSPMKRALFFEFEKPEMIRVHANWADLHKDLFKDPRFFNLYEARWIQKYATEKRDDSTYHGFFVRKDALKNSVSAYWKQYNDVKNKVLTAPPKEEAKTFFKTMATDGNPNDFGKMLFEFLPEMRERFSEEELQSNLRNFHLPPFYNAWFSSAYKANWFKDAQNDIFYTLLKQNPILDSAKGLKAVSYLESDNLIFIHTTEKSLSILYQELKNNKLKSVEIPSRNLIELSEGYGFVLDKNFGGKTLSSITLVKRGTTIFTKTLVKT